MLHLCEIVACRIFAPPETKRKYFIGKRAATVGLNDPDATTRPLALAFKIYFSSHRLLFGGWQAHARAGNDQLRRASVCLRQPYFRRYLIVRRDYDASARNRPLR